MAQEAPNVVMEISPPKNWMEKKINDKIFCTGYTPAFEPDSESALSPVLVRWGGNTSSRFNFLLGNVWNAGADWNFANVSRGQGAIWERWILEHRDAGEMVMFTVPILGWLAKDTVSRGNPKQPNPGQTSVPLKDTHVYELVSKLRKMLPNQERVYPLDNEPFQWHHIHGDAISEKVDPKKFAKQWLRYAKIVRDADKDALLAGPGLWGWGDLPNLQPFLKEVLGKRDFRGKPYLNIVSASLYPQNKTLLADLADITGRTVLARNSGDDVDALRLETTANLDDESYVDPSWINAPVAYVPTLQKIVQLVASEKKVSRNFLPQIAIAEYNWGSPHSDAGAAAQASLLLKGLRLPLHHMCTYTWPPPQSEAGRVFRALRETVIGFNTKEARWKIVDGQSSSNPWVWFGTSEHKKALIFVASKSGLASLPLSYFKDLGEKKGDVEVFDGHQNMWRKVGWSGNSMVMVERFGLYRWQE